MRLVEICFPQGFKPTPQELALIQDAHIYGDKPEVNRDGEMHWWQGYLMDASKIPLVPHTVKRIVVHADRAPRLNLDAADRVPMINQKISVALPGFGLLMLNDVKVLVDCCTDVLSDELEDGWRIIAACPQPDQRRPDYVLGRTQRKAE